MLLILRHLFFYLILAGTLFCLLPSSALARDRYDIVYLVSKDLERVLDYKEELEAIFEPTIRKKIKVMGRDDEYALIFDGNYDARTVAKTLIVHAEALSSAGYDEPFAVKDQNFHSLYNVTYGMGPNIDPLKDVYSSLYSCLGEEVKANLFIEKTDYGNYKLIYRVRGNKSATTKLAKQHAKILRGKKIKTSVALENNNPIVYGETSLMDDKVQSGKEEGKEICVLPAAETQQAVAAKEAAKAPAKVVAEAPKETIAPVASKEVYKVAQPAPSPVNDPKTYTAFEKSIEDYIEQLRRSGKISSDESTGWMVYDLKRDKSIVDINADHEFQAASMIKPFVALAFFHQVKAGKVQYGSKSRRQLEAMIQRSSNPATNWTMRMAGGPAQCDAILKKYYGHIFKGTKITEYIPAGGRTYLNSAPPGDYVRFLRALWNQELPYDKEIRRLMALPGRDRLYHGTPIPRGTLVYNKTGSTAHLCGDMGILVPKTKNGDRYPYAIVGIIERRTRASDYGRWMDSRSRVIREVSTLVYEQMKKEHKLL